MPFMRSLRKTIHSLQTLHQSKTPPSPIQPRRGSKSNKHACKGHCTINKHYAHSAEKVENPHLQNQVLAIDRLLPIKSDAWHRSCLSDVPTKQSKGRRGTLQASTSVGDLPHKVNKNLAIATQELPEPKKCYK